MNIAEMVEKCENLQGKRWVYLALGRTLQNEVDAIGDDVRALPAEQKGSEQVIRDYYNLKRSIALYLLQCGYDV